jgi:hypothetical protein
VGELPIMQTDVLEAQDGRGLVSIPVVDAGPDFPLATLRADPGRAHALLDLATHGVPRRALSGLDRVSRAWLVRHDSVVLPEVDAIARALARPGAYFLSCNYEWGCTCRVAPAADGSAARLVRVLDWRTPGLGRYVMAVRVQGAAGRYVTLTWPGFTGVLQAVAPGRFAIALNQAPMRRPTGLYPLDWALNRRRVWGMPHETPAGLLRRVFETAPAFAEATRLLVQSPIAAPAIYSVAGVGAGETAVIERCERAAFHHDGPATAANHWQARGWQGSARGLDSAGRARLMGGAQPEFDPAFPWLAAPVLNRRTRLVMMAEARTGRLMAQGYETAGPATRVLEMTA